MESIVPRLPLNRHFGKVVQQILLLWPLLLLNQAQGVEWGVIPSKVSVNRAQGCVVLLHGLGRHATSMKAVEWVLRSEGFRVENIDYPSLFLPVEELAELSVAEGLQRCHRSGAGSVHFVTHSLGGVLVRYYFSRHSTEPLGRVVMLGPPNQGSELADYLLRQPWFPSWAPPAARQLGTGSDSLAGQLVDVTFELGVLAGTRNLRPLLMGSIDDSGPSDGTVLVSETRVAGMRDFIQLPVSHTFMMWNRRVLTEVVCFLRHGRFSTAATGD